MHCSIGGCFPLTASSTLFSFQQTIFYSMSSAFTIKIWNKARNKLGEHDRNFGTIPIFLIIKKIVWSANKIICGSGGNAKQIKFYFRPHLVAISQIVLQMYHLSYFLVNKENDKMIFYFKYRYQNFIYLDWLHSDLAVLCTYMFWEELVMN